MPSNEKRGATQNQSEYFIHPDGSTTTICCSNKCDNSYMGKLENYRKLSLIHFSISEFIEVEISLLNTNQIIMKIMKYEMAAKNQDFLCVESVILNWKKGEAFGAVVKVFVSFTDALCDENLNKQTLQMN